MEILALMELNFVFCFIAQENDRHSKRIKRTAFFANTLPCPAPHPCPAKQRGSLPRSRGGFMHFRVPP
jgi:hypothetical protein